MSKEKVLPKQVFISWEMDSDPWLNVARDLDQLAEEEPRQVGVYQLIEKMTVQTKTEIIKGKSK